jgi:Acetyltransferase (GNAT) family
MTNQNCEGRVLTPADLIERSQWDFFWIPEDATVVDRPELLYVHCRRDRPLLNCVTRTRASSRPLSQLVAEVQGAHVGVTSRWLVRDRPGRSDLEAALCAAGYAPAYHHGAYAKELDEERSSSSSSPFQVRQVNEMASLEDWYAVADAVFEDPEDHPAQELERFLDECTREGARVHRFVAYQGGRPVSCGGMTSFASLRFGYLWSGGTIQSVRGQGAYRAVLQARLAHARKLQLTHVGLYAREGASAPIVEKLGFRRYGAMSYWDRAAQ